MKISKPNLLLIGLGYVLLLMPSCKKDNACKGVITCIYGFAVETETGCECECIGAYIGLHCSTPDPAQVQVLLDDGKSPISLLNRGVPIDSIYGKMYKGGLIFYLDTTNNTGMVAAPEDQSSGVKWGCGGTDIIGLITVQAIPQYPETAAGARIGFGAINTDAILDISNGCTENGIAAKLCREIGTEWFLPSRGELNLMYINLRLKNLGGFTSSWYWSSTENGGVAAWNQSFIIGNGTQTTHNKSNNMRRVRAARAF